ncbi:MAG TPA: DUF4249 family protein [Candidatus Eisenbacteria bacterium]|nr:DUF4249 family protein [Candidatus Eisenbacteria bacterium]
MRRIAHTLLLLALTLGAACSTERDPGDLLSPEGVGQIVVDGTLIVGQPMPRVLVRKTLSPAEPYDRDAAGVEGADVRILEAGTTEYQLTDTGNGRYVPASPPIIQPNTEYRLLVRTADGRNVSATTTTPGVFNVQDWVLLDDPSLTLRRRLATYKDFPVDSDSVYVVDSNRLVYQDGLLEARFDRGAVLAFQVGLQSLDPNTPYVIDADFLDEEDLAELTRDSSSPPLAAEENSIRLPWFAIFFEGRYRIRIFSIDRNWYDLARSLPAFGGTNGGFGGNAGDSFERPIFHVEGGIGLFASGAMDEIGFTILPKP